MSFMFFNARTLILVLAGLAGTSINSPGLNGLGTPFLAGRAGTFLRSILTRPGTANTPGPLLLSDFLISADRASKTALMSFLASPVTAAMLLVTSDFDGAFLAAAGAEAFAIMDDPPCGFDREKRVGLVSETGAS